VFSPSVTVFDETDKYKSIFTIREAVFDLLVARFPSALAMMLDRFSKFHFLFAEMVGRIHAKLPRIDSQLLADDTVLYAIMQNLAYLKASYQEVKSQVAMATIYLFLFALLDDPPTLRQCFSSECFFLAGFLPDLVQPSLQKPILDSLLKFLCICSSLEKVASTLDMLSAVIMCSDSVQPILSLISTINHGVDVNPRGSGQISTLVPYLTSFLQRWVTSECLQAVIQFCMRVSVDFNRHDLEKLARIIQKIDGTSVSEKTVSAFFCMMMGNRSASLKLMGLIQRSSTILPFLSLFHDTERVKPYLECLEQFCRASTFNCYQCHCAGLDLLLLEMLLDSKCPFVLKGLQFDWSYGEDSMLFVCFIASVINTPPVTLSFLALAQRDNRVFETIRQQFFSSQRHIFAFGHREAAVEHKNAVTGVQIQNAFTIQLWMKLDVMLAQDINAHIALCSIIDSNSRILFLQVGSSIVVRVCVNSVFFSAMMATTFPMNVWTLVTLTFQRTDDDACVFSYSIGDTNYDLFTISVPFFFKGWADTVGRRCFRYRPR
jgi:hypothetical protein